MLHAEAYQVGSCKRLSTYSTHWAKSPCSTWNTGNSPALPPAKFNLFNIYPWSYVVCRKGGNSEPYSGNVHNVCIEVRHHRTLFQKLYMSKIVGFIIETDEIQKGDLFTDPD